MIGAFATPRNRRVTYGFLVICAVSAAAAALMGISDNPPGILTAFGAVAALILAFVHPWRSTKRFAYLLCASILGFAVFAVLHNILEVLAARSGRSGALQSLLQGSSVVTFLLAILVCPPAIIVSGVGAVVMLSRNHRPPGQEHEKAV